MFLEVTNLLSTANDLAKDHGIERSILVFSIFSYYSRGLVFSVFSIFISTIFLG